MSISSRKSDEESKAPSEDHSPRDSNLMSQEKLENGNNEDTSDPDTLEWDSPNDPANPYNFSTGRKWFILTAGLVMTLLVPVNGTSITVAARQINAEFGISDATFPNSYWPVASWGLGGAIFVIVGLPLIEDIGVRVGTLAVYAFFILMIIPQSLAQNFATLIITRFFSGGCVIILANLGGGLIADLFADEKQRSLPVSLWILAYLIGNTLGPPMFAGILEVTDNWRWIFYAQLIIFGAIFPLLFFGISETRSNVILKRKTNKLRRSMSIASFKESRSAFQRLGSSVVRPAKLLFTEPVLFAISVWSAFSVGTVYMFTQSITQVYEGVYGWKSASTGYVQVAVVIGEIVGLPASIIGTRIYFQSAARNTEMPGRPIPEARLYVSVFGSFVGLAGGMFVYAWTADPSITWVAPTVGLAMVGFSTQVVINGLADYVVDAYAPSTFTASAVSGVAFAEDIFAAFLPLSTEPMYTSLGFSWASTLLGFIGILLSFAPVVIIWKGRQLRERSPFMLSNGKSFNQ